MAVVFAPSPITASIPTAVARRPGVLLRWCGSRQTDAYGWLISRLRGQARSRRFLHTADFVLPPIPCGRSPVVQPPRCRAANTALCRSGLVREDVGTGDIFRA